MAFSHGFCSGSSVRAPMGRWAAGGSRRGLGVPVTEYGNYGVSERKSTGSSCGKTHKSLSPLE